MPIVFGTTVLSATFAKATRRLTVVGQAFAENQYAGSLYVRKTGTTGAWIEASSIVSWADELVVGVIPEGIGGGSFDVRILSGDSEEGILTRAFSLSSGGVYFFFDEDGK